MKETFDGKITWEKTGKSVTLTGLSREQMEQVLALTRASGAGVSWELLAHRYTPPLTLGNWWRRLNAWLMPILLISILSVPAMAQGKRARAIEPLRVEVTAASDDRYDAELARLLNEVLRGRADVALVSARTAEFSVTVTADELDSSAKCVGVIGAMVTTDARGRRRLALFTASDMKVLATRLAMKLTEYSEGRK